MPLEKSRKPERALDKLIEFASEFTRMRKLIIFQGSEKLRTEAEDLRNRLSQIAPSLEIPIIVYDPIIAAHIGPEGLGLIVYEGSGARW